MPARTDRRGCEYDQACSEFAGVVVWMYLVERIGRRHSQGSGYFLNAAGALLLGVVGGYNTRTAFATIARLSIMGASSATWVATPEAYPTRLRATGHSIANAVARLGGEHRVGVLRHESASIRRN
jgi:hypothetical protein